MRVAAGKHCVAQGCFSLLSQHPCTASLCTAENPRNHSQPVSAILTVFTVFQAQVKKSRPSHKQVGPRSKRCMPVCLQVRPTGLRFRRVDAASRQQFPSLYLPQATLPHSQSTHLSALRVTDQAYRSPLRAGSPQQLYPCCGKTPHRVWVLAYLRGLTAASVRVFL